MGKCWFRIFSPCILIDLFADILLFAARSIVTKRLSKTPNKQKQTNTTLLTLGSKAIFKYILSSLNIETLGLDMGVTGSHISAFAEVGEVSVTLTHRQEAS